MGLLSMITKIKNKDLQPEGAFYLRPELRLELPPEGRLRPLAFLPPPPPYGEFPEGLAGAELFPEAGRESPRFSPAASERWPGLLV